MKLFLLLATFLGVFSAQLAVSEAMSCYTCSQSDFGCDDVHFDTSQHGDWLKPCDSGRTCDTIFQNGGVTRQCRNEDTCDDGALTSYSMNCVNNVCTETYCCTGNECNSAPGLIPHGVFLTALMVLTAWVFK